MRRHLSAACACIAVVAAIAVTPVSASGSGTGTAGSDAEATRTLGAYLLPKIRAARRATWRWERLMRIRRTPASGAAERSDDPRKRRLILSAWTRKAATRRRQAYRPPRLHAWLCIKRYEGPWHDPHPPYYGGLQMDLRFQRTYAPELLEAKGTANRWTPIEQIWVAERAYRSGRGFSPWPNTARSCGLL